MGVALQEKDEVGEGVLCEEMVEEGVPLVPDVGQGHLRRREEWAKQHPPEMASKPPESRNSESPFSELLRS